MKVYAVGGSTFVTGFKLSGAEGIAVESPQQAFQVVKELMNRPDVGLIIVSEDLSEKFRDELNELRARKPTPLVYELSPPVGSPKKIDYRQLVRSVLGV
ncbi:MAG: V-type ATP synthase subunit F [Candidatus Caldarchaeum sp.]|nr:V-type ATP synthase subunit F [Candidatus Caldarchaeum sp.]